MTRKQRRQFVRLLQAASLDELADVQEYIEKTLRQASYDCGLFRNGKENRGVKA